MPKSPSSLYAYLRFYKDLGIEYLYLPARQPSRESAPARRGESEAPSSDSAGRGAAVSDSGTPPKSEYRPPDHLFSAAAAAPAGEDPATALEEIRNDIGECTRCRLHQGRTNIVFGVGNPNAKLVFVGEGPGADEDAQGIPFVGRAGQLLTQMINNTAQGEGLPIERKDVYICNVVKCRPPGNRAPEAGEMETCGQFLERQLAAIRPKAICVLGGTAAKYLLQSSQGITKIRGQWKEWRGIPVMPTYHPSFLLRPYNQARKREAWEDLKKLFHYVYD